MQEVLRRLLENGYDARLELALVCGAWRIAQRDDTFGKRQDLRCRTLGVSPGQNANEEAGVASRRSPPSSIVARIKRRSDDGWWAGRKVVSSTPLGAPISAS